MNILVFATQTVFDASFNATFDLNQNRDAPIAEGARLLNFICCCDESYQDAFNNSIQVHGYIVLDIQPPTDVLERVEKQIRETLV